MDSINKTVKMISKPKLFALAAFLSMVVVMYLHGGKYRVKAQVNRHLDTVMTYPPLPIPQTQTRKPSLLNMNEQDDVKIPEQQTTTKLDSKTNVNQFKTPEQCYRDYLGPTQADDLAKIESYRFEGVEKYVKDLFPPKVTQNVTQKYPTFVGGFSSNHFEEGLVMLDALNETVRTKYTEVRVIVFDLGLTKPQLEQLNDTCSCEIRKFDFSTYPKHVRSLHNFAWKAIVIQTVAKDYPFLVWMDTSIRFKTKDLDDLFKEIREKGLLATYYGKSNRGTIAERTHLKTFELLDENPCTYATQTETQGGFIMLHANPFITKYFLYPFVACALSLGCMEPFPGASNKFLPCPVNMIDFRYHLCHRSDQSIVGILFHRLFHKDPEKHKIDLRYFRICRNLEKIC